MKAIAAAAITAATALCPMFAAPAAHAAGALISAGDRIETDSDYCTLGYAFTSAGHSYAITAGHCQSEPGQRVRDDDSGATGAFVRARVDPHHTGGADYALIDFGIRARVLPIIADLALAPDTPGAPRPGQTVCRTGATTGTHCGTIRSGYGPDQYLTNDDMTVSEGGDSGGPVWVAAGDQAHVIGIWLGGIKTADGHDYGRFASLTNAFTALDIP